MIDNKPWKIKVSLKAYYSIFSQYTFSNHIKVETPKKLKKSDDKINQRNFSMLRNGH